MSMNLFLALAAEHKQRTDHDVHTDGPLSLNRIACDVCLFLGAYKRESDEAEERHWREVEAAAREEDTRARGSALETHLQTP